MNSVLALRLFSTHIQFLVLCIIQYVTTVNDEKQNTEGTVSDYCRILPTPAFVFNAWERLLFLTKHISECIGRSKQERNHEKP